MSSTVDVRVIQTSPLLTQTHKKMSPLSLDDKQNIDNNNQYQPLV